MEAIVCARWVAESIKGTSARPLSPPTTDALPGPSDPSIVRPILSQGLGVLRDQGAIRDAVQNLCPIARGKSAASDPALVGLMIAVAAYQREESRGGHCRTDFPDTLPSAIPSSISLVDALSAAREIVETETRSRSARS
jgi:L-aspartate oxidase